MFNVISIITHILPARGLTKDTCKEVAKQFNNLIRAGLIGPNDKLYDYPVFFHESFNRFSVVERNYILRTFELTQRNWNIDVIQKYNNLRNRWNVNFGAELPEIPGNLEFELKSPKQRYSGSYFTIVMWVYNRHNMYNKKMGSYVWINK
jgi:hypothetical protein